MTKSDKKEWVDIVADVAAALGLNRVRVRWKLDRMRRGMKESAVQTKGKVAHVRYHPAGGIGIGMRPPGNRGTDRANRQGVEILCLTYMFRSDQEAE
jgi:hypothetical protein